MKLLIFKIYIYWDMLQKVIITRMITLTNSITTSTNQSKDIGREVKDNKNVVVGINTTNIMITNPIT